jgi:vacuolar-type H+-ATPase subunit I/STV1
MMKRISMLSNKNKNQEPKSDEIKNRESWLKIIIIGAFALLLFYKIATAPFIFRFSDFISLFCSLFAIAVTLIYFNKINKLEKMLESYTKGRPVQQPEVQIAEEKVSEPDQTQLELFDEKVEEAEVVETADETVEEPDESEKEEEISEEIFETQRIKEEELAKIEMDKTQIYNELFTRAQLNEEEMKYFNERIREKETESFNTKQELNQFKERIQNVFKKTPQLFQKRDSRIEGIVRMLNPVTLKNASLEDLNQRLDGVIDVIPTETLDSLVRDGFLDSHYHLTRSGYREFVTVSKTFQ